MRIKVPVFLRPRLRVKVINRLIRNKDGATAVEFALVSFPFFALLFAIIETSLVFYAGQILETAVADTGRLIMTGQAQTTLGLDNPQKFKDELCKRIAAVLDCQAGVKVDVRNYGGGTGFNNNPPVQDGVLNTDTFVYEPGGAGNIIVVRAVYEWPVFMRFIGLDNLKNGKRLISATTTFRNEPF